MKTIAVIKTGGKQYIVSEGKTLTVEKIESEVGSKIEFDAMLISDEEGSDVKIGTPIVDGAKISAVIKEHGRAKKISVIKYKSKSRYRRNIGHRQPFTKIQIEKITA